MRAEYNILEKRKWRSLAEEKNILLEAKDQEIEDLKSQLLKAKEESAEVTQLRAQVSGLEATENSLRGEVASVKDHNVLLEQEYNSLKLKVTGLESTIAEKDHELSDLGASSSSLEVRTKSFDQDTVFHSSAASVRTLECMRELETLEEFQDNLMGPSGTRLAETDDDFNYAIRDLHDLNFSLLRELSNKKDARTWDIMDLLRFGLTRVSVEDYDNPDSSDVVPENATLGSESEGKIHASAGGGLTFSQLDDEARDAVL
ncbi:hypothetical protein Tco_0988410 [Tanacetum coccineum]|uniref:Uncharacterized protein n=1 Tax=Tanacetum coccineum TaxID=301880 RepID=A0ABQ5EQV8_9ASTR